MAVWKVGGKGVIQNEFVAGKMVGCVVEVSARLNAAMGDLYDIVRPLAERHPKLSPPGYFPDLE